MGDLKVVHGYIAAILDTGATSAMTSNGVFSGKQSISGLKGENVQEYPRPVHDGKGRVVFAEDSAPARVGMKVLDVSKSGTRPALK